MGIKIIFDLCTGCGSCISTCPFGTLNIVDNKALVCGKCSFCGACVEACPVGAIVIEKKEITEIKDDISKYKDIWVIGEHKNNKICNIIYQLLGKARELANKLGVNVSVILLGSQLDENLEDLGQYGADEIIYVKSPILKDYYSELYVKILTDLIRKHKPEIVLIGATPIGRDYAPRISKKLNTGLTADCTDLNIDPETRNVLQTRPTFGGNIMATIKTPNSRPQMSTVREGVFKFPKKTDKKAKISIIDYDVNNADLITKIIKIMKREKENINLEDAEIIVAGGRGVGSKENFQIIKELAEVLNAEIAGSRVAVDLNWIEPSRQIGQTGKTVSPKLYVACGISGAIQHIVGMRYSDIIVAINRDPNAPIFEIANWGIIGDLHQVIPALIKEIKRIKTEKEIEN